MVASGSTLSETNAECPLARHNEDSGEYNECGQIPRKNATRLL